VHVVKNYQLPILSICMIVLAGCSSDKKDPPAAPALNWAECSDDERFDCATLDVPRDYLQRDAETIELALRRKTAPAATRKGVLLINAGGPGPALNDADNLVDDSGVPDVLINEFDIVAFDPRGVGSSTPVDCQEFLTDEFNIYPITEEDIQNLANNRNQFAMDCSAKYGDYLQLLGSQEVVNDMEEIRQALGEEKLNFLGRSFGTRLGALYLQTYPQSSGAFVLDASVPPDSSIRQFSLNQLQQFQTNLETLLGDCARIDPTCNPTELIALAESRAETLLAENAEEEFGFLFEVLIASTLEPDLTGTLTLGPLVSYLQDRDINTFALAIQAIFNADAEGDAEGDEEGEEGDAHSAAVLCGDDSARPDASSLISDLAEFNQLANIFAEYLIGDLTSICVGWPEALNPVPPIATSTVPQALVIGGSTDPITPLQGSRDMAAAIGGYFLESEHTGHTTVFTYRRTPCHYDLPGTLVHKRTEGLYSLRPLLLVSSVVILLHNSLYPTLFKKQL